MGNLGLWEMQTTPSARSDVRAEVTPRGLPEVVESYRDYEPQYPVAPIIRDLLRCVSRRYLGGLRSVTLTNSSGQGRHERRATTISRGRKVDLIQSRGFYQPAARGQKASIVLYVDNILGDRPPARHTFALRLYAPFMRRIKFALVLYHEIGHHIHYTKLPQYREKENVADRHKFRLLRRFYWRRWYLAPLAAIGLVLDPTGRSWLLKMASFLWKKPRRKPVRQGKR